MKNRFLFVLSAMIVSSSSAVYAADNATSASIDGGFGSGPYFTAQAPEALSDAPATNAVAGNADHNGDLVSKIEPAAGGSVFTLPEEPAAAADQNPANGILAAPAKPIVPGMTVDKTAQ